MLKINRLTGLQGKTGPETAGPVNRAREIFSSLFQARKLLKNGFGCEKS